MYLVIGSWTTLHFGLLDDLKKDRNVRVFITGYKKQNVALRVLRRLHTQKTINSLIDLPKKEIWFRSPFEGINENELEKVIVIDSALAYLNIKDLYDYRNRLNIDFDLQLVNSLDSDSLVAKIIRNHIFDFPWSHIYTFDRTEAQKYDFEYRGFCYYSARQSDEPDPPIEWDAYFVGGAKGNRELMIYRTYQVLIEHGANCRFQLSLNGNEIKDPVKGIEYIPKGWISYSKVIENLKKSRCIIEILQENQDGPSLRYFEAVCYNRKLHTNNPKISTHPYYNERYMRVYSAPDKIDFDWLLSNEPVNYGYKGDFSSGNMLY